jgi:hypothetical protein
MRVYERSQPTPSIHPLSNNSAGKKNDILESSHVNEENVKNILLILIMTTAEELF